MTSRGRIALIIGGTGGIGAATAQQLAEEGARVFVAARTNPGHGEFDDKGVSYIACDVTEEDAVRSLIKQVREQCGRIDLAVNAAGYEGQLAPLHEYSLDECRRLLDVNVIGTFLPLKHELEAMRNTGGGAIVNIASIAGLKGIPNAAVYTATKHAVIGMTRSAALESADVPIRVNAVCPSLVDTAMADRLSTMFGLSKTSMAESNPMRRMATPGEVARTICWLLSDAASFVNGQALGVDGAQSIA